LQTGFFTHAGEFAADMPNYTDMVPQVQISVTVKWSSRPGALVSMIS